MGAVNALRLLVQARRDQRLKRYGADSVAMNIGNGDQITVNNLTCLLKEDIESRSEITCTDI